MKMVDHPLYRSALSGAAVRPTPRRHALCIYRGRLVERVGTCNGNHIYTCDSLGETTTHNGRCQTCPSYEADAGEPWVG